MWQDQEARAGIGCLLILIKESTSSEDASYLSRILKYLHFRGADTQSRENFNLPNSAGQTEEGTISIRLGEGLQGKGEKI